MRLDSWLERGIEIIRGEFKALMADLNEKKKANTVITKGNAQVKTRKQLKRCVDDGEENQVKSQQLKECGDGEKENQQQASIKKKDKSGTKNRNIKEECWRGQNEDARKTDKNNVKVHRARKSILNVEQTDLKTIPYLLNGGLSKKISGFPSIFSSSTCGPDSIYQLLAASYADNENVKDKMNDDDSEVCEFVAKSFTADANIIDAMRNNLMTKLFPEMVETIGSKLYVDCEENITTTYTKFCELSPQLSSVSYLSECCGRVVLKPFVRFNLQNFNVEDVQSTIYPMECKEQCLMCGQRSNIKYTPQIFITFDTEGDLANVPLKDVQRNIEVDQQEYELVGVIESKTNQKHFIAHILRGNEWITYDDLEGKTCKGQNADKVVLIMYRKAFASTKVGSCSSSLPKIHNSPSKTKGIDTTKVAPETPTQENSSMVLRCRNK